MAERLPYPAEIYPGCPCWVCDSKTWTGIHADGRLAQRLSLCPSCGDKRCRGAMDHMRGCVRVGDKEGGA